MRKANARARKEAREQQRFWVSVLSTPIGRREMWRILDELGTFRVEFANGPVGFPDPHATFFKLGQSSYGQRFYGELLVWDRAAVMKLHDENDPRFVKQPRRSTIQDDT